MRTGNFNKTKFTVPTGPVTAVSLNNETHTVKLGINYHFNWGGPVVAKN